MAKLSPQQIEERQDQAHIDWTQANPWGEVGVGLPANASLDAILKAAKLDWEVHRTELYTPKGGKGKSINTLGEKVEGFAALQRSDTHAVLDICGSKYTPVQNKESFAFFKKFVEAGKAKLTGAGEMSGGRHVWAMADLNKEFIIGKEDVIKSKLVMESPHEQGKSFKIRLLAYRMICGNGLMGDSLEGYFRMSHRMTFDESMMAKAEKVLGLAHQNFEDMMQGVSALSKKKVSQPQSIKYMASVFDEELANAPPDEILQRGNKAVQLAVAALEHSPGFDLPGTLGTAWGLLNGVTYTIDHLLGRTPDARLRKAWFGKNATLKQRAFTLATEI